MKITAINNNDNFITATFTWNNECTECNHVAIGVTNKDWDKLIAAKVHEGCSLEGWTVTID